MIYLVLIGVVLIVFALNFFKYAGTIISLIASIIFFILAAINNTFAVLGYMILGYYSLIGLIVGTILTFLFNYITRKQ